MRVSEALKIERGTLISKENARRTLTGVQLVLNANMPPRHPMLRNENCEQATNVLQTSYISLVLPCQLCPLAHVTVVDRNIEAITVKAIHVMVTHPRAFGPRPEGTPYLRSDRERANTYKVKAGQIIPALESRRE